MTFLAEILSFMGEHFIIIALGCIELLAAIFLIGSAGRQRMRNAVKVDPQDLQQTFLNELNRGDAEVYILVRREDYMPIYTRGNIENLLNVSLKELQDDITILKNRIQNPKQAQKFWKQCREWDGHSLLRTQMLFNNDKWIQIIVQQSENSLYDLFSFMELTDIYNKLKTQENRLLQAEKESKSKTSFLYQMSHEIRTPMNGIMGMLTLAKEASDTKNLQLQQYLDKTEEVSEHLLSLINDILDMSRIEADKVELEERPFSLHAMGSKLYDMFAQQLETRGIYYAVNYEDITEDRLIGDELRISQVLINFL